MVVLYHGSPELFEKPENEFFRQGSGSRTTSSLRGFHTTDTRSWAMQSAGDNPMNTSHDGVLYKMEIDNARLENWLREREPIGQAMYDKIMAVADKAPKNLALRAISPQTSGNDVFDYLQGQTPSGMDFIKQTGIEGRVIPAGGMDDFIFFDAKNVPPMLIDEVHGNFPAAEEAFKLQKETGKLSVEKAPIQPAPKAEVKTPAVAAVQTAAPQHVPYQPPESMEIKGARQGIAASGNTALAKQFEDTVRAVRADTKLDSSTRRTLENNLSLLVASAVGGDADAIEGHERMMRHMPDSVGPDSPLIGQFDAVINEARVQGGLGAVKLQQAEPSKPVAQPLPAAEGPPREKRAVYNSESLENAARAIHKTGDAALINAFENATDALMANEQLKKFDEGFVTRERFGQAVSAALSGEDASAQKAKLLSGLKETLGADSPLVSQIDSIVGHAEQGMAMKAIVPPSETTVAPEPVVKVPEASVVTSSVEAPKAPDVQAPTVPSETVKVSAPEVTVHTGSTNAPSENGAQHGVGQNVGRGVQAAGILVDLAAGRYGEAAEKTGMAVAGEVLTSQTAFEVAARAIGVGAKHVPVIGGLVTAAFVGQEVLGHLIDGNYGQAAAATVAGTTEALVNTTGLGLIGGGDAARELVNAGVGATFGQEYRASNSGLRDLGEKAYDLVVNSSALDYVASIVPSFTMAHDNTAPSSAAQPVADLSKNAKPQIASASI